MAKRKATKKPSIATAPLGRVRHDDEIRWVAESLHAATPPQQDEAPSTSAWSLFQWASSDEDSQSKFWTQMYGKVASKEKAEERPAMTDDQRVFFRLFSTLEREKPELLNERFPRSPDSASHPSSGSVPSAPGVEDGAVRPVGAADHTGVPSSAVA